MPSVEQLRDFPWEQLNWLIVNQGEVLALLKAFQSNTSTNTSTEAEQETRLPEILPSWPSHPDIELSYSLLHRLHTHHAFSSNVNLVCTLGGLGVIALLASEEAFYVPAAKLAGFVRDTTGAGDCFTGYLVSGLMEVESANGEAIERILRTAVEVSVMMLSRISSDLAFLLQAAGICVQRQGATESIPYKSELVPS